MTTQRGQTQVLILAGIVLVVALAGGIFYLGRATAPKPQAPVATSSPQPSSTSDANREPNGSAETVYTESDRSANWKTYTHSDFTFKYPGNWYPDNNLGYPGGNNVGFFIVGTEADHGYGDHKGNDVFAFEASDDTRSLEELKSNYYPDAVNVTISGKPAIRTSFNLYNINYSPNKKLNVVGGKQEAKQYINQILSTFKFTD